MLFQMPNRQTYYGCALKCMVGYNQNKAHRNTLVKKKRTFKGQIHLHWSYSAIIMPCPDILNSTRAQHVHVFSHYLQGGHVKKWQYHQFLKLQVQLESLVEQEFWCFSMVSLFYVELRVFIAALRFGVRLLRLLLPWRLLCLLLALDRLLVLHVFCFVTFVCVCTVSTFCESVFVARWRKLCIFVFFVKR